MAETIDGATIAVGLDAGSSRAPFILDRDHLDTAGMVLTPASDALTDVAAEVIAVDGSWGATDWDGPLTVVEAGTMTVELYDPDRGYDPANPDNPDPPAIGRALAIRIDGALVWSGRLTRVAHDWDAWVTTLEAEDAIAEASRLGVTAQLSTDSVQVQLTQLVAASGWPSSRFVIHGALTRTRYGERFTGTFLEGLQRLQAAELGALFADASGRLIFRGRGQGPVVTGPRMTVGLEPGSPVTTIETSTDARFVNAVYVEPVEGPVQRFADEVSVSQYGEVALEVAASDLMLV